MTRDEFGQWHDDLESKLPETADYIAKLPQATRDMWFAKIFAAHPLADAIEMNDRLMLTGEGLKKYDRDELPSLFRRLLQEITWTREDQRESRKQSARGRQRQTRLTGTDGPVHISEAIAKHPVMGPMFKEVLGKIKQFKRETNGQSPPAEMIHRWTEQASETHDTIPDDEENMPRYRCRFCRDSGVLSFERDGTRYIGCCPDCDAGRKRNEAKHYKSSVQVGYAPSRRPADDNQFNAALMNERD